MNKLILLTVMLLGMTAAKKHSVAAIADNGIFVDESFFKALWSYSFDVTAENYWDYGYNQDDATVLVPNPPVWNYVSLALAFDTLATFEVRMLFFGIY